MILQDHSRFVQGGNKVKDAKEYHNCIGQPFFRIPLTRLVLIYLTAFHLAVLILYFDFSYFAVGFNIDLKSII